MILVGVMAIVGVGVCVGGSTRSVDVGMGVNVDRNVGTSVGVALSFGIAAAVCAINAACVAAKTVSMGSGAGTDGEQPERKRNRIKYI